MTKVSFVLPDDTTRAVEAEPGWSLMEVAVNSSVPGIDGDCGGQAACATCHVYVDSHWRTATGEANAEENAMLDNSFGRRDESRLACQITIDERLDGLTVTVAEN